MAYIIEFWKTSKHDSILIVKDKIEALLPFFNCISHFGLPIIDQNICSWAKNMPVLAGRLVY